MLSKTSFSTLGCLLASSTCLENTLMMFFIPAIVTLFCTLSTLYLFENEYISTSKDATCTLLVAQQPS